MKHDIIFISDLHIALSKKEITENFLIFLNNQATQAQSVYILGDLFDVWIGDDDNTPPNKKIKTALKKLTDSGTQVFLQVGNRDFLIAKQFSLQTGVQLLDDYAVIELNGVKTLLTHGDLLCTDDLAYQQFRLKSHTPEWQQHVLSKPLILRILYARWYRLRSFFHKRKKSQEIMDVNQQTVINTMSQFQTHRLIHGHTHRSAIHNLKIHNQPSQRFVLPEWKKESVRVLCWSSTGFRWADI